MKDFASSAKGIGSVAGDVLQEARHGQVTGITSGGVFLSIDTGWVLYLSFVTWCGPLTINLSPLDREDMHIQAHSHFQIWDGAIFFSGEGITIEFYRAERWSPPPRPRQVHPPAERAQRFARVSRAVTSRPADRFESGQEVLSKPEVLIAPASSGISALRSRQPDEIIATLTAYLGRGPGLTPAGDDQALGFLLAINRWGDRLCPNLQPESINQGLIAAARQHTTALSASLIECAAHGLADERLVAALDGLVTGNLAEDCIVEYLQSWGHTSGVAAFQGMELVMGLGEKKDM